jgi:hypothetical protein
MDFGMTVPALQLLRMLQKLPAFAGMTIVWFTGDEKIGGRARLGRSVAQSFEKRKMT